MKITYRLLFSLCFHYLCFVLALAIPLSAADTAQSYRSHLEYLAAYGAITIPISTHPINQQSLQAELNACHQTTTFPLQIQDKCLTVEHFLKRINPPNPSLLAAIDNQNLLFNHLSNTSPPFQTQLGIAIPLHHRIFHGHVQIARASDPLDNQAYRFDGTHIDMGIGNWLLGVGAIDRWWGPGWHSSLILSHNARPTPGVYFSRAKSMAPKSQWFNWIGPWHLTLFMNQLESERTIPDARFWGMRINFRPTFLNRFGAFEIGLSRTAMWGGEGRPTSLSVFSDLLIGNDNVHPNNAETVTEPGNQLGGIDFSFTKTIATSAHTNRYATYGFYGQVIGEDESGGLPSRPMALLGANIHMAIDQSQWTLFVEASDTALDVFSSKKIFNSAYTHSIYRSGYRYKGRTIGSQYDNDTRAISIGTRIESVQHTSEMVLSHLHLNRDSTTQSFNSVSSTRTKAQSLELSHQRHFQSFNIGMSAFYITELPPNTLLVDSSSRLALTCQFYF